MDRDELQHQLADLEAAAADAEGDDAVELSQKIRELRLDLAALEAVTPADADDLRPAGAELVVADPSDEHEVFLVLDRHDEDLIVQELQRRVVKTMLYDFTQAGSRLVDLSSKGVNECIRLMNRTGKCAIRVLPTMLSIEETIEDGEEWVTATVYAEDAKTQQGHFGTASQPKRMKVRSSTAERYRREGKQIGADDTVWDKFARAKAMSKAQRNALAAHIPETMRQTLIAQYTGNEEAIRVIKAGAGAAQVAELPPPLTDEKAEALKARAREVFQEIREHDPLKLLPAQFHVNLTKVEHSHERLEDFVGMLEQKRDEAKAAVA